MGLFRKEKQKEEENINDMESANKKISKNVYTIYLKEKVGNTVATFAKLPNVKRWFDPDEEIAYLKGKGFLEVFPDKENDYLNINRGKIEKDMNILKSKLTKIKELEDPAEIIEKYGNPKNIEFDLLKKEAQFRALKYEGRSYMTFGQNGEKEFVFIREGSHYIPQAIDNETFTAFFPSDSKKKSFAFTHRNKQQKHGMKQLMNAALAGAWIFGLAFLFGTAYLFFQAYDTWSDSDVNKAKAYCLDMGKDVMSLIKQDAEIIHSISTELQDQLRPQVMIEGVAPK